MVMKMLFYSQWLKSPQREMPDWLETHGRGFCLALDIFRLMMVMTSDCTDTMSLVEPIAVKVRTTVNCCSCLPILNYPKFCCALQSEYTMQNKFFTYKANIWVVHLNVKNFPMSPACPVLMNVLMSFTWNSELGMCHNLALHVPSAEVYT